VRRIVGTNLKDNICQLHFYGEDKLQVAKLETVSHPELALEVILEKDEEIIGLYGTTRSSKVINSIGFITWRPP